MSLRFLILPSFLFTRNLRIDKNYTLSIFMLSGSIQFCLNFQFNMTCSFHKIVPFISNSTHAYSFSHAFTLQIIDHVKICNSTCNKSFNSNHEIQTYTLKEMGRHSLVPTLVFNIFPICYLPSIQSHNTYNTKSCNNHQNAQ